MLTPVINPAKDTQGQRIAALELMKESLLHNAKRGTRRSLADGYYAWVDYLSKLEARRALADLPLRADELEGLVVLAAARDEFQRAHPPCAACGTLNPRHAFRCAGCARDLKEKKK